MNSRSSESLLSDSIRAYWTDLGDESDDVIRLFFRTQVSGLHPSSMVQNNSDGSQVQGLDQLLDLVYATYQASKPLPPADSTDWTIEVNTIFLVS